MVKHLLTLIIFITLSYFQLLAASNMASNEIIPVKIDVPKLAKPVKNVIDIKVSPNPADDVFYVNTNVGYTRILMYNIIGKSVKNFAASSDQSYYIGDLPGGIYILRFLDSNNQVIKNVKLYKNN